MSHTYTHVEINAPAHRIGVTDTFVSVGSCFSENIGLRLYDHGFETLSNPFGTLYNAVSISRVLREALDRNRVQLGSVFNRQDVHFHYDYHSDMSALTAQGVVDTITTHQQQLETALEQSDWLLLTLGTSIVHTLVGTGEVVANCHKMPSHLFEKKWLSIDTMTDALCQLLDRLPHLKVIVTVSPIRHIREGLVENQRSKARLIETAHRLSEEYSDRCAYFPAYELLMDELRDYRYYSGDLIHPSPGAIDIVWERFTNVYFDQKASEKKTAVSKLSKSLQHRSQFPHSESHQKHLLHTSAAKQELLSRYPEISYLNL